MLGAPAAVADLASVAVLAAFVAVNVRGVTTSGLVEDVVVVTKLAVLGGIAAIGLGDVLHPPPRRRSTTKGWPGSSSAPR